jgi:drug/metabolite transporter (DMT)-like permease
MRIDMKLKGVSSHLAASLTMIIWGTTFISTKILLRDFSPIEILLLRFIIGYAALLIVYPHFLKPESLKEELLFAAAGLCGITLYYMLENTALTYTFASDVGIIISAAPFFTAILAHFLLNGEKLHVSFFVGFFTSIIGISLINLNGSFFLKSNPMGDVLAVLAAAIWAVYSVLMKKISEQNYNTIACTRRVFFYGILFMIPVSSFLEIRLDFNRIANGTNLFNLLFLGLGASALCFVTWNFAVGTLGAVKTSVYIYLVPVITVAASALILHEKITWVAALGAILTMAGLFVSERKVKTKEIIQP